MTLQPRPASEVASCDPYAVAVRDPAACYNPRIRALATTARSIYPAKHPNPRSRPAAPPHETTHHSPAAP